MFPYHLALLASLSLLAAGCGPSTIHEDRDVSEARDCVSTEWSEWSECSLPCGGGERFRSREITVSAANGGAECGALEESEACNSMECPIGADDLRVAVINDLTFSRLTSQEWMVVALDGTTVMLDEVSRDEWSVYLDFPGSRPPILVQIDLFTEQVMVFEDGELLGADSLLDVNPERLSGFAVSHVTYDGGAFVQINADKWFEHNGDGMNLWDQVGRDTASVRLENVERGVTMRLDLQDMQAQYAGAEGSGVLYTLRDTQPETIDGHLMREVLYDGGRFVKVAHNRWEEQNDDGSFSFNEARRDPWSAYLYDASRDVSIQLDLYTQEIYVTSGDGPRELLYSVSGAN